MTQTPDPTKHLLGYGRRNEATGMLHGHIRWPHGTTPPPFSCRWCGIEQRSHGRRYLPRRGYHNWEQPTQAQIKARMLARRAAFKAVCRCVPPEEQYPLAPVFDPWKCEAEHCRMHDRLLNAWLTPLSVEQACRVLDGGVR
ncbi:hypothetical protein [Streptomyces spiralis]|uniref:hypothetical protein n=1 Tax=Streptomyces spiralis TaxID=66376 RepID=UPI0036C7F995